MPAKQTAKVMLVGDSGVGKSTILSSYRGERYNHVYVETRGEIQNAFIGMHTILDFVRGRVSKLYFNVVQFFGRERN